MKKNKFLMGCILLVFVLLPFKVNASSTIYLKGDTKAGPSSTIVYNIELNSTSNAKTLKTDLTYDSTVLELVSIINKDWSGSNTVGKSPKTLEFTSKGVSGKSTVASLTFKVKSSTTKTSTSLKLSGTTVTVLKTDEELVETAGEATSDIKISSTDATLSSLKVNDETVNGFRGKTYNYNIIVDGTIDTANIKATVSSDNASFVDGYGPREEKLNYGANKIEIRVKAESGDIKRYTINITREDTRIANYYLKDIIINSGKVPIEFDKLTLDYTIKTYKLETLEIEATPDDEKSTVKIDKPKDIKLGENIVKITVKSETGKTGVYTLTIINSDEELNTKLKNLAVKGKSFDFDPNKLEYEIVFDNSMKSGLTIYATTQSNDAKIEILDNNDLKVGSKIKVRVYAEDGSETIYIIKLVKDKRINFFMVLELIIIIILVILLTIQIKKKNKNKNKNKSDEKEINPKKDDKINDEQLENTIEMDTTEFKIN